MNANVAHAIELVGPVRPMPAARPACPSILARAQVDSYDRPREEQRIVAFFDLIGSTAVVERLGNVRFHALLSDVFTRLSLIVAEFGGEVHRYVGDALIATWPLGGSMDNSRSIRCLFACQDALESAGPDLLRRHGHKPVFRASMHSGPLAAGEMGGRGLALVGDAMNTVARIEQACRTGGHRTLVSKGLLAHTAVPKDIVATSAGVHLLRGKAESLELFTLERCQVREFALPS